MFEIGDKVSVVATGRVGEVVHYRKDRYRSNGKIITARSYGVKFPPYFSTIWYKPSEITHLDKFEDGFELGFANLMIDIYLEQHKYDIVKYYSNIKNKLLK